MKDEMIKKEYHSVSQISSVRTAIYKALSEVKEQSGWDRETKILQELYDSMLDWS